MEYNRCSICQESVDKVHNIVYQVPEQLHIPKDQLTEVCDKCTARFDWIKFCMYLGLLK